MASLLSTPARLRRLCNVGGSITLSALLARGTIKSNGDDVDIFLVGLDMPRAIHERQRSRSLVIAGSRASSPPSSSFAIRRRPRRFFSRALPADVPFRAAIVDGVFATVPATRVIQRHAPRELIVKRFA